MAPVGGDEYVDPSAALPPWLHLLGVAERSEFFKIMIAGGNHSAIKSWQPERADLSARRRYASEQPPQAALSESQRGFLAQFIRTTPSASRSFGTSPYQGRHGRFAPHDGISTRFAVCGEAFSQEMCYILFGGMNMDQVKIGKFIAALRKEKAMTQEQLGAKLGVTNKTVSRWETGVSQT